MGRRWGNALGGWRKQPRKNNGQFGRGAGGSSKKRAVSAKRKSSRRKTAARTAGVVVGVAAVGGAAYAGRTYARERGLKAKHGSTYVPKVGVYSHYTSNRSARVIAKTRTWKPTSKHAGHGAADGVWLTRHSKLGHYDGMTRDVFGKAKVSTVLSRRQVLGNMTHAIPGGLDKSNANIYHVQVHKDLLNGRRVHHNLPKTRRGTRRRAQANFSSGMSGYQAARNMAVNPYRARGKKLKR